MEPKILILVIEQQAANICICLPAIPLGEITKEFSCRNKSDNNCINLVSSCLNHIINHLEKPRYYEILFTSLIWKFHFFNVKTKMVTKSWTWTEIKALKYNSWCVKITEIRWRFKKQKIRWKAANYFFDRMYFWNVSPINSFG